VSVDFGRLAPLYDRIRPVDDNWRHVYDLVVREADLRGQRVLDLGCGTGRLSTTLAEQDVARVWGVDASPEMLAVARRNVPSSVGLKEGRAERLPFRDGWFDRTVMWLVCHLVDRPAAFPGIQEIDLARFPSEERLRAELEGSGFGSVRFERLSQHSSLPREAALDRIHGRHISTFDLLSAEEIASGTALAERELPDPVEYDQEWLIAIASTVS
jgi:SAM-dependent methyltransferase